MIAFFPSPYHDEILYSVIARYHLLSGNSRYRQTARELFGNGDAHRNIVLPANLTALSTHTEAFGLPREKLLLEHTIFPYLTAFYQEKDIAAIRTGIEKDIDIYCNLGALDCANRRKHMMFCPRCYAEELKYCGEGYWHRLHQSPGVLVCKTHQCDLLEAPIDYYSRNDRRYLAASAETFFPACCPPRMSPLAQQQANWIAEDAAFVYENYARIRNAFLLHGESFHIIFRRLLQKRRLATDGGLLRLQAFREEFLAFFALDLLERIGLYFDDKVKRPWIVSMCRREERSVSPLRYVVLSRFLCGGLRNLLEFAEANSPDCLSYKKTVYHQVADFEVKREKYRAKWMAACRNTPNACQNEIRKTAPAVYTWLYRHDKDWLRNNPRMRKKRGGNKTFADWTVKDDRAAQSILLAAQRLRAKDGKPVRVTMTGLLREAGLPTGFSRKWRHLPRTKAAIDSEIDDTMTFRIRKMHWAEQELAQREEPAVKWRVLRLAGIREEDWADCWTEYLHIRGREVAS